MAFAAKRLASTALTTTLTTTLYTNPGGVTTIVKDIEITNTGATNRSVTISMPGTTTLLPAIPVLAGQTVQWKGHIVLNTGETIKGGQDVGTDVNVLISGAEG